MDFSPEGFALNFKQNSCFQGPSAYPLWKDKPADTRGILDYIRWQDAVLRV